MSDSTKDTSRLKRCGWSSFRPQLFLNEPGRKSRDLGSAFVRLLKDYSKGKRVLELCCGAGKLLIQLARQGYNVVGLDLSHKMLEVCRREVEKEPESVRKRIRLVWEDMCTFELKETYHFIILEDDGFGYLLTQEEQLACLRRVGMHLSSAGLFFLSCKTPDLELACQGPYEYDPLLQIKKETCKWDTTDEQGKKMTVEEGFERRKLTYPCELELLLEIAGLVALHRWGDLDRNPFTDPSKQAYNYLIRKKKHRRLC